MSTLTDHLIAARVDALEEWQTEHAQAMSNHDLDESLAEVFGLSRDISDILDQAPESRRKRHVEWLAGQRIFGRLLLVTEGLRDLARVIGYFQGRFQFPEKAVDGLIAFWRRAIQTGLPSQRMKLDLDLTNLPPRIRTPE